MDLVRYSPPPGNSAGEVSLKHTSSYWSKCLHTLRTAFPQFLFLSFFFRKAHSLFFFFKFYLFLEKGREGERGRETSRCGCLSWTGVGNLACNPGMYPNWESNQRPFGSQAGTQSTEPHQPGPIISKNSRPFLQNCH